MMKSALKKKTGSEGRTVEARARQKAKERTATAAAVLGADGKPLTKAELADLKRRDALVAQYMPYAASIANRVCQSLSSAVEYEEVLCNARLGLIEAAKRFDATQEVDFRTFAYYRIKGAIYDGLRRSGWLPRTLYAKIKFEEAANEYLQHRSLQTPEAYEEAKASIKAEAEARGIEFDDVSATVNGLASIYIVSLDANEDIDVEDENSGNIEQRTEFMQVRRHMRDAIGSLPEKEKLLIMMYYFQNRTLEEIGERLGLSKSWTSRLHARALALLFKRIRHRAQVRSDDEGNDGIGGRE